MKLYNQIWYHKHWLSWLFLPLSWLYQCIVGVRRYCYKIRVVKSYKLPTPVIIVGNLTVGGTGKTPLLIALVEVLKKTGFKPGVISRGYGGSATHWPQIVNPNSDPMFVGDEPVLISKNTRVPVIVGPRRVESAKLLLSQYPECNVIISDDGLQHYALVRDVEIVVVDGLRRFGNERCLPAGPLREPMRRLKTVDYIVCNGAAKSGEFAMTFEPELIVNVADSNQTVPFTALQNKKIIAVAGIGNPDRFFKTLTQLGLVFEKRIFADHHVFEAKDIQCDVDEIILMTEKDAVKCVEISGEQHWYVKGRAVLENDFKQAVIDCLRG